MNFNNKFKFIDHFTACNSKRNIQFLILHHIQANCVKHAISQLLEHKVSSHFLIDEDGEIYKLVDENNIAYHAGTSYWRGFEGLNANSIGIELINKSPFEKKFEKKQMQKLVELCHHLLREYNIDATNVAGHCDIAYYPKNLIKTDNFFENFLDRKQDPSHLFDWKFLAQNGITKFPDLPKMKNDEIMYKFGSNSHNIANIKQKLHKFGYKVNNFDSRYDIEMCHLARVFQRRFNPQKFNVKSNDFNNFSDQWFFSSQIILDHIIFNLK